MIRTEKVALFGPRLDEARLKASEIKSLTQELPDLSLDEAYAIQDWGITQRLKLGERRVGYKMGLTSVAKMDQMGLRLPIYGILTDAMEVKESGTYRLSGQIHPKIEPEIAFLVRDEIQGIPTREQALAACSGVCVAMEILDSRFVGFKYFSLPDVVADNCSSSQFIVSASVIPPNALDLKNITMELWINGELREKALSNAILGDPVASLIKLCEILQSRNLSLKPGSVVLAGAATQAVPLEPGMKVEHRASGLGSVGIEARA